MAKKTNRDEELSTRARINEKFLKVLNDVEKGVSDQQDRSDEIKDAWDAYDCIYSGYQFYNGNSQVFISLVADAVDARQTRFTNQLFPQSQRYVEVTSENEDIPHATTALLEHYVRRTKLRTEIVPPLFVAGETWRASTASMPGGRSASATSFTRSGSPSSWTAWSTRTWAKRGGCRGRGCRGRLLRTVEVILDSDLIVLPATAKSIDDALEQGGSVIVVRRWRKAKKIRQLIKAGEIRKEPGEALLKSMDRTADGDRPDTGKRLARHAGIKAKGDFALIHEVWTRLDVDGESRLCRGYGGGDTRVLSVKLNPYWCDECPVISAPVKKKAAVVKGIAPIRKVLDLQYAANDTLNEGLDTGHFSAMPIIFTDPEKNPRVSSMVLGLGAVWETSPNVIRSSVSSPSFGSHAWTGCSPSRTRYSR